MPSSAGLPVSRNVLKWAVLWSFVVIALSAYSYRLMALPDRTLVDRTCTLFHTDVREAALTMRTSASALDMKHPLARELWWPFGYVVRQALEPYTSTGSGAALAACIAMAFFGAIGILACALAATACGVPFSRVVVALPVAILSTTNAVVMVPEFYGISFCLLSITFLASVALRGRARFAGLTALTALLAATTLTNGVFGLLCLLTPEGTTGSSRIGSMAMRAVGIVLVIAFVGLAVGALTGVVAEYGRAQAGLAAPERASGSLLRSVRIGRIETIDRLATYSGLAWVYPVIGPSPHIASVHPYPGLGRGRPSPRADRLDLSYDPWRIEDYGPMNGFSAIAWVTCLLWCSIALFRACAQQRRLIGLLGTWICGNILVHLVWGDEMFMYSPHWSWALSAIFLQGSRSIPASALLGITATIAAGQAVTITHITEAATRIANICQ